jgi:terminase small subunit / prophage DNA-packing protein
VDLHSQSTQSQFGELVGISQQAVSNLVNRGVIEHGETLGVWLLSYCSHLRETAAGREAAGDVDLATERGLLAREQRMRIAMQNAEKRKELAPSYLLEQVLARAGARVAKILDTITPEIRRRLPQLTNDDLKGVNLAVAKARNLAASVSLVDLEDSDLDDDDSAVNDLVEVG